MGIFSRAQTGSARIWQIRCFIGLLFIMVGGLCYLQYVHSKTLYDAGEQQQLERALNTLTHYAGRISQASIVSTDPERLVEQQNHLHDIQIELKSSVPETRVVDYEPSILSFQSTLRDIAFNLNRLFGQKLELQTERFELQGEVALLSAQLSALDLWLLENSLQIKQQLFATESLQTGTGEEVLGTKGLSQHLDDTQIAASARNHLIQLETTLQLLASAQEPALAVLYQEQAKSHITQLMSLTEALPLSSIELPAGWLNTVLESRWFTPQPLLNLQQAKQLERSRQRLLMGLQQVQESLFQRQQEVVGKPVSGVMKILGSETSLLLMSISLIVLMVAIAVKVGQQHILRIASLEIARVAATPKPGEVDSIKNYLSLRGQLVQMLSTLQERFTEAWQAVEKYELSRRVWHEREQKLKVRLAERNREYRHFKEQVAWFQGAYHWSLDHLSDSIRTGFGENLNFLRQLERVQLSSRLQGNVQELESKTDRVLARIDSCLLLQHLAAGRAREVRAAFSPAQLLDHVVTRLNQTGHNDDIQIASLMDADVPAELVGDAAKIRHIILTLGRNALHFTESGQIVVRLKQVADHLFRFEVNDTGTGLSIQQQHELFDETHQPRAGQAQGLGLLLCQQLLRLLKGRMGVESESGQGSCFWFELNLYEPGSDGSSNVPATAMEQREQKRAVVPAQAPDSV